MRHPTGLQRHKGTLEKQRARFSILYNVFGMCTRDTWFKGSGIDLETSINFTECWSDNFLTLCLVELMEVIIRNVLGTLITKINNYSPK